MSKYSNVINFCLCLSIKNAANSCPQDRLMNPVVWVIVPLHHDADILQATPGHQAIISVG